MALQTQEETITTNPITGEQKGAGLLAALFLAVTYAPTIIWMADRWNARESYYSHGILIPFIAVYLAWTKRDEIIAVWKNNISPGSRSSLFLLSMGLLLHWAGQSLEIYFISGLSLLVVLSGLAYYLLGLKGIRLLAFPISFLLIANAYHFQLL